ncbi:MAG: glycosyltransferase family 4 protein [Verrucomicrobia bacterium]|nr:glycosyltransferase family 4 protein [Verrucomicrobiota bacterium]
MKIAQVAPLYESVPPKLYGGTERVVSYLTEELIEQGHEVTLFASGDSQTKARLVPGSEMALRLQGNRVLDPISYHVKMLEEVFRQAPEFDVVQFHLDYLHLPLWHRYTVSPFLTTLHGRLDIAELGALFREYPGAPFVSISDAQRAPLSWLHWLGTVHHGLPLDLLPFNPEPEGYLAVLGRICPEKGIEQAIEVAVRTGRQLKIAAKVDRVDRLYFETRVEPLLGHPLIEFVGEISQEEKKEFLGNAAALLMLIDWPEPFGLAMIEALACGTPVIARPCGSVPELLVNGKTAWITDTVGDAVEAVNNIHLLRRQDCRNEFETRFRAERMAQGYIAVYDRLLTETFSEVVDRTQIPVVSGLADQVCA